MISHIRTILAVALLACSVSAQAAYTSYAHIRHIQIDHRGAFIFMEQAENPNGCTSASWYALDPDSHYFREYLATAYQAQALRIKVKLATSRCTNDGV